MENDIKKINTKLVELEKQIDILARTIKTLSDTSYKTSAREIINREIQFMQKVYDKSGGLVTEINAT